MIGADRLIDSGDRLRTAGSLTAVTAHYAPKRLLGDSSRRNTRPAAGVVGCAALDDERRSSLGSRSRLTLRLRPPKTLSRLPSVDGGGGNTGHVVFSAFARAGGGL